MLGLSRLFLGITIFLALLGFTGLAGGTTGLMQMLSLIFGLFFLLALLFSRTAEWTGTDTSSGHRAREDTMSTQCTYSTNHSLPLAGAALQQRWPRLTEDDLERIDGRRHLLVERLQSRYEIDPVQAEIEVRRFELSLDLPLQLTGTPGSGRPHGPVGGPPPPPCGPPRAVPCPPSRFLYGV